MYAVADAAPFVRRVPLKNSDDDTPSSNSPVMCRQKQEQEKSGSVFERSGIRRQGIKQHLESIQEMGVIFRKCVWLAERIRSQYQSLEKKKHMVKMVSTNLLKSVVIVLQSCYLLLCREERANWHLESYEQ